MSTALFDPARVMQHAARSAHRTTSDHLLIREASSRLAERMLEEITPPFETIFEIALRDTGLSEKLRQRPALRHSETHAFLEPEQVTIPSESADAIVSTLHLHWVNDLPGLLAQCYRALKPGGLFLANFLAGSTLSELRHVLAETDQAYYGGITPRTSPMIEVKMAGQLLQRAGFSLPVSDAEILTCEYSSLIALMHDLRTWGQTNALFMKGKPLTRDYLKQAEALYRQQFGTADGYLPATFEIVTITGWK